MKRSLSTRSRFNLRRWVGGLMLAPSLLAFGCAMPEGIQDGFRMPGSTAVPGMPGGPAARMPGSTQVPQIPNYNTADASNASDVMPVGFQQPMIRPIAGACGCNLCSPGASFGPGANCGPGAAPHGYAMPPAASWSMVDPQEYLCDGGDQHPSAVLNRSDLVVGLQPEDTVVHYTTDDGNIEFQASNRACLYAPRFSSVRRITGALAGSRAVGLAQVDAPVSAGRFEHELPQLVMTESTELGHADVARRIDAMREQIRGVPVERVQQLHQASDVLEALAALSMDELRTLDDAEKALLREHALAAVTWELDESLEVVVENLKTPTLTRFEQVQGFTIYDFPDAGRLQISKLADRGDAQPGEIVRFVLHIKNVGDSATSDVTLIDNLTTRLEYVDGSQSSTVEAEFEVAPNESESLKLRWKLQQPLEVGEEATIEFECRVR